MKTRKTVTTAIATCALALVAFTLLAPTTALARKSAAERLAESSYASLTADAPVKIQSSGELEVAFSPHGGSTALVIKVIESAKTSIRVLAYSFTSAPIAQALVQAHKRGVDVQVVVDKSQKSARYASATFIANAGIPVRIDFKHAIAHNKVIIVDGHTVEQGSFNYTKAAEEINGENVLVNWDNVRLAEVYLKDWKRHWEHSEAVAARY
jgi:phosphatidylserine/phosphatidylglycerophosphate/cardiolipin synthase-like enzyme